MMLNKWKRVSVLLCICVYAACFITSCQSNQAKQESIIATVQAFDGAQDYVLLTDKQLIVRGATYDVQDIRYNGRACQIVHVTGDGFYAYTFDEQTLAVQYVYITYMQMESTLLGEGSLPSGIIHAFWAENCFWFRIDDPTTDEFNQVYYAWDVATAKGRTVDSEAVSYDYEYAKHDHSSSTYAFSYQSKLFGSYMNVTNRATGQTKRIDKTVLKRFEEGRQIKRLMSSTSTAFSISRVFERNGDVYVASYLEVGALGDPCYYYIFKWNFETEECTFYTAVFFDAFQDQVLDIYILE